MEADFVVLDPGGVPGLDRHRAETLAERLFALMVLGGDRAVERTYLAGHLAHGR
jgi:guanine deaminase